MGDHFDFQEIQNRVNLYLDNAYNAEQQKDFLDKVSAIPEWNEVLNKEKKSRDLLKHYITRPKVTTDLLQNIRDNISLH